MVIAAVCKADLAFGFVNYQSLHWGVSRESSSQIPPKLRNFYWGVAVPKPKILCHTSRVLSVGIEPTSPQTKAVTLPTTPQVPLCSVEYSCFFFFRLVQADMQLKNFALPENQPYH
jgi:hypothetical protein